MSAPNQITCPKCGVSIPSQAKFCNKCGEKIFVRTPIQATGSDARMKSYEHPTEHFRVS